MTPRRWVYRSAWALVVAAIWIAPATAQFVDSPRTPGDLPPDPVARSARLLGMGRLTLMPDVNNRLGLWDFGGNPAGLYDADSTSIFQLRPATSSSSSAHDLSSSIGTLERQDGASRDSRVQIEGWRRPEDGTTYGVLVETNMLRSDAAFSVESERRSQRLNPTAVPVVTGPVTFFHPDRLRYALVGVLGFEDSRDEYRRYQVNGTGEYLDRDGTRTNPPDLFNPDESFVRQVGGGFGLGLKLSPNLNAGFFGKIVSNGIEGKNDGERYSSETRERRPIYTGQATLTGKVGPALEWGVDGQSWSSSSATTWVFTISPSGGPGPTRPPLTGRGDLSKRKEEGTRMRLRGRWISGAFELGAAGGTLYQKTTLTPAPLRSANSFNSFRLRLFSDQAAADTVFLPEDVLSSGVEQRDWEAVGGISRRMSGGRGAIGVEYHVVQRTLDTRTGPGAYAEEVLGLPPSFSRTHRTLSDVRAGLEYAWTPVLMTRAGYIFRQQDLDEHTEMNETLSHTATGGIGVRPGEATWNFDLGYAFEWGQADYGSPELPRFTRQQLAIQVRWVF